MSKKYAIKVVFLTISAIVSTSFLGCGQKDAKLEGKKATATEQSSEAAPRSVKSTKKKPGKPKPVIDMLPATSVVVRVNGENITKQDFTVWERTYVKIFAMLRGWSPNTVNAETKKFRHNNRSHVLDDLVTLALFRQYARAEGIEPDPKGLAQKERDFLRMVHKPKAKFADVAASFGKEDGEMLNRMVVQGGALTMAVLVRSTSNDLYRVTAQEFTNRINYVEKTNRDADASNAVVRARAVQAKKEILAGAIFADVAKKYADFSPEQGEEWETFQLDEFDGDNPLGQWLARSDTGDVSDPLVLDDGIAIVGLKAKYESDLSESNKPPVYAYEVVRCVFHDYDKKDDFDGDRKSIERDMIRLRRLGVMNPILSRLKEKAAIEFPCGHNLFYPPEKKSKKINKKQDRQKAKKASTASKGPDDSKGVANKDGVPEKKAESNKKVESEKTAATEMKSEPEKKVVPDKKPGPEKKTEPAKVVEPEKK
ncbi:MAG: hypothetical protein J6V72_04910 [Kiritimatiellae bacterium]|nr:hypothetical protein [Kiritimatiellia bacterium]